MYVIKADGRKEEFKPKKIIHTCLRAGIKKETAIEIAEIVKSQIKDGSTTNKIYQIILKELKERKERYSFVYRLKEAISQLGPENFEKFTAKILDAHGYKCRSNRIVRGSLVEHEIDVIAQREQTFPVECKFHRNPHRECGLSIILQVNSRVEDLMLGYREGKNSYNFSKGWVFTNTKFSGHARRYATG